MHSVQTGKACQVLLIELSTCSAGIVTDILAHPVHVVCLAVMSNCRCSFFISHGMADWQPFVDNRMWCTAQKQLLACIKVVQQWPDCPVTSHGGPPFATGGVHQRSWSCSVECNAPPFVVMFAVNRALNDAHLDVCGNLDQESVWHGPGRVDGQKR